MTHIYLQKIWTESCISCIALNRELQVLCRGPDISLYYCWYITIKQVIVFNEKLLRKHNQTGDCFQWEITQLIEITQKTSPKTTLCFFSCFFFTYALLLNFLEKKHREDTNLFRVPSFSSSFFRRKLILIHIIHIFSVHMSQQQNLSRGTQQKWCLAALARLPE